MEAELEAAGDLPWRFRSPTHPPQNVCYIPVKLLPILPEVIALELDTTLALDRILQCFDRDSDKRTKDSVAGLFGGRQVRVSITPNTFKYWGGGPDLVTHLVNAVIDSFLGIVVNRFFPSHRLTVTFECQEPMTVILSNGSMGDHYSFEGIRRSFISNDTDRCKRWFAANEVQQSMATLLKKFALAALEKRANETVLEAEFGLKPRHVDDIPEILDHMSALVRSMESTN